MAKRNLDEFFEPVKTRRETRPSTLKEKTPEKGAPQRSRLVPNNLSLSYFVSAAYDGKKASACMKLYDPEAERIHFWYDNTEHKPYLLTNLSPIELEKIDRIKSHRGFDHFELVQKYDALQDQEVILTKVVAKDPLAIGGRPVGCIRDIIPEDYPKIVDAEQTVKVWEAAIKYYQCYIYDRKLAPGMIYEIHDERLVRAKHERSEEIVTRIRELFQDKSTEVLRYIEMWARLLEYPAPQFRRVALDIEVLPPVIEREGVKTARVPDPREAEQPVTCASLYGSNGERRILLLRRENIREGTMKMPLDASIEYYSSEKDMILEIFKTLLNYPFVITFNGDDFDLRYLFRRAQRFGFRRDQIPIEVGRRVCLLTQNIHIDLYKFFFNRSIQIYAFNQKYRDVTLDNVGKALIGLSKINLTRPMSELTYMELAQYCFRDAEITFRLTSFDDNLTMKLILVLTRISRMPMEDVSRQGVSRWIRNFIHHEHRRKGMLIPNAKDILMTKGTTATKAIIKGKKYKGAIVVEPVPGVHFNVAVMDFASLYPSIIKVHNLGYQTILCSHEECKDNTVPETPHWVCTRHQALESLLIGALRDLRVKWYKPKSKDQTLSPDLRSWYNVIQSAVKVILNASYGVFGAETFDLYCPPVAEATASIGRHLITQSITKARDLGIEVIYGDTDSIFVKGASESQIRSLAKWSEEELGMELDVDKIYRYAVFSSRKKNYLGVFADGNVDVKGLTGKKRHIPLYIKKAFDQMEERLARVKSPAKFEAAKNDIQRIVQDCYLRLKRRDWGKTPEELAFQVVLGKIPDRYTKTTPQHVKAATLLQDRGYDLKAGDLISFVKVTKKPHVKPVELASNSDIDVDKYVAYLQSTFDQILDAIGLSFDEIIGLTKLERFM